MLGAGLLGIDFEHGSILFTTLAALLVVLAAAVGVGITWNHRWLERRKFIHLMNCEQLLGLHRDDIIPLHPDDEDYDDVDYIGEPGEFKKKSRRVRDGAVKIPEFFTPANIFNPSKHSTALFILRIHISIILFCVLIVIFRWHSS